MPRAISPPNTVLVTLVLLATASSALGGNSSPGEGLAGTHALQFSVKNNFTLGEFQGQMISYQRYLTDDRALRVAAGLFLDYNDKDVDVSFSDGDETGTAEISTWTHRGTIKLQYMFYRGDGPLRLYWGAGPRVSYSDNHGETANFSSQAGYVEFVYFTHDTDTWELGIEGFAGVEWFINDLFSLHAEYAVSGKYVIKDEAERRIESGDPDSNQSIETSTRSPEFDSDGVRFGLSAHF
jgi:hypothetical protein